MAEMGKMNKRNLIIIILLMLVSGLLIYYLYLKPEAFAPGDTPPPQTTTSATSTSPQTTIPSGCPTLPPLMSVAVLSRYFGVGFNIYPANGASAGSTNSNSNSIFLIEHIPVVYNGSVGSMYAVSNGQLTIKLRNDIDPEQWWIFNKDSDSTSTYYNITPYNMINTTPQLALQYENGNLSIRPKNPSFESQKWIYSNTRVTRGIPVLNYGPASLFTPEFNPFTSNNMSSTASISQSNNQQVSDVINFIKTNIQQYLATTGATPNGTGNIPPVSASSLGNKDMPLNINVNLGSGTGSAASTSKSSFDNITGTTTSTDLLSLLNKYETSQTVPTSNKLFSGTDLATSLQTNQGCASLNIGDYTSNRVSSCNCKL